jgi:hypothetical protein
MVQSKNNVVYVGNGSPFRNQRNVIKNVVNVFASNVYYLICQQKFQIVLLVDVLHIRSALEPIILQAKGLPSAWYCVYDEALLLNRSKICSHCNKPCWPDDQDDLKNNDFFTCGGCLKNTCIPCNRPHHPGTLCNLNQDCIEELKQVEGAIQCLECGFLGIFDDNACNKINCSNCNVCIMCVCCKARIEPTINNYAHFCRTFFGDMVCEKTHCKHCYLWPNERALANAPANFLRDFPKLTKAPIKIL